MDPTNANDPANQAAAAKVGPAESSDEREEARLEHGIKESFPGSDPVSVKVSKYAPGDPRGEHPRALSPEKTLAEGVVPGVVLQARGTAVALSESARASANDLLDKAREYVPGLEDRIEGGKAPAEDAIRRHPLTVTVTALLIGCGVGVIAYELMSGRKRR